jgi:hypothetical protein
MTDPRQFLFGALVARLVVTHVVEAVRYLKSKPDEPAVRIYIPVELGLVVTDMSFLYRKFYSLFWGCYLVDVKSRSQGEITQTSDGKVC